MNSDDSCVLLFSYGTLQLESVQLASFGRLLHGQRDSMPGYKSVFIEITDPDVIAKSGTNQHPMVIPSHDQDDEVSGQLFRITPQELAAADAYEVGDYQRVEVALKSGKRAWVYVQAGQGRNG